MTSNSLSEVFKKGRQILAQAGIEEAGLDAWLLLEYETGFDRGFYLAHPDQELTQEQRENYFHHIQLRSQHVPLQHLTHQAWFMGYEFFVDEHVLIPRQDTECVVERALQELKKIDSPKILDMCTGSGCIILSILAERQDALGIGCDLSSKALEIAKKNAENLQLTSRIKFLQGDLFDEISENLFETECFLQGKKEKDSRNMVMCDMIISNPPYIATDEIQKLSDEVKLHDPVMALDGKEDGLYFYRRISRDAKAFLKPGGILIYEIGYDQGQSVSDILEAEGYTEIKVEKDLAGMDRVVYGVCG